MINSRVQPDIKFGSRIYSRFKDNEDKQTVYCKYPILGVYENLNGKPLLIVSEGGQGKSTCAKILQADLLCKNTPCHIINCRDITVTDLRILIPQDLYNRTVIVFDGWDEIPSGKMVSALKMLDELLLKSYQVAVTSRYNPTNRYRGEDESEEARESRRIFKDFTIAEICPFTESQIKELSGCDVDSKSRFFALLENTMYMCMYLDMDDAERRSAISAENSYQFVHKYFEALLKKDPSVSNVDKLLKDIGEQIYLDLIEEYSDTDDVNISPALNGIVYQFSDQDGNLRVHTNHFKYKTFCLSVYLKSELVKYLRRPTQPIPEPLLIPYWDNYEEALIYLGEGLSEEQIEQVRAFVDYSSFDRFVDNILYILLGNNHQCFDDKFFGITDEELLQQINGEDLFSSGISDFLFRNKYVLGIYIHSITEIEAMIENDMLSTLYNLQSIEAATDHSCFYSKDNCLIRKSDNTLVMGCYKSKIPYGVTKIGQKAFFGCEKLVQIEIPDSVEEIELWAFCDCPGLIELNIPDSVIRFRGVMDCQGLRKLSIGSGWNDRIISLYSTKIPGYYELEEITVSDKNPYYCSDGNCLIRKLDNTVILGCKNSVIPPYVKVIGTGAFENIKANEIVIPCGVETVELCAFAHSDIKKLILPNTVRYIEHMAFLGCYSSLIKLSSRLKSTSSSVFMNAYIDTLIVPRNIGWDKDIADAWLAEKFYASNIYFEEADRKLTSLNYTDEMKVMAKDIARKLLIDIDETSPFDKIETDIRKSADAMFRCIVPPDDDDNEAQTNYSLTWNAIRYIKEKLYKSSSIEEFKKKLNID